METETRPPEVSVLRLNFLRLAYALLAFGLGAIIWPQVFSTAPTLPLQRGVVVSMLGAVALLGTVGLVHPLKMLPILFFEFAWKAIWLLSVALPLSMQGDLDAPTRNIANDCLVMAIVIPLIPWRYVFNQMKLSKMAPWRRPR